MDSGQWREKQNPIEHANFISKIFFCWMMPFFMKGYRRDLQTNDFYRHRNEDAAEKLGDRLEKEWKKELVKKRGGKKPSLVKAAWRTFGLVYTGYGMFSLVGECVTRVIQPVILGWLVRYFSQERIRKSDNTVDCVNTTAWLYPWDSRTRCIDQHESYLAAGGVILTSALYVLTYHPYYYGMQETGMKMRVACCSLIYKKSLRLSKAAMGQTTVGQMVNLLSNDVNKFDESLVFLPFLVIGPLQTIAVGVVLWTHLSYSCLAGLSVLILYIPFQAVMGKIFSKFRSKIAALTDERIRLMNETIGGMRVIKMYTWEQPFVDMIANVRKREVSKITVSSHLRGLNIALFFVSSKIILFVTFLAFVLIFPNDLLNAEVVFVSMSLFNNLRLSMTLFFPYGVAQGAEAMISLRRLQKFLLLDEQEENSMVNSVSLRPQLAQCGIWLEKTTAKWNDKVTEPTLENITASVEPGELLAIVGPVGSGKSSFLMTVLGELPTLGGSVKIRGKVAYASQEPWVFAGSVKQNVLFGHEFDDKKYRKVVHACALERDIQLLPFGDRTLVGERGMSLSGGQKARVNLARAVYLDADVYLMDDPLSAVDSAVAKHLFEQCINGYLKSKVRILVTHQVQFLKAATKILVLKQGKIFAYGSYSQLISSGVNLMAILESAEEEERKLAARARTLSVSSGDTTHSATAGVMYESTMSLASFVDEEEFEMQRQNSVKKDDQKDPEQAEEGKSSGAVGIALYWRYMRAGAGYFLLSVLILSNILTQAIFNGSDIWLKEWTDFMEDQFWKVGSNININTTVDNYTSTTVMPSSKTSSPSLMSDPWFYVYVYTAMVSGVTLLSIFRGVAFYVLCMGASVNLHNQMFSHVIRAPVAFFDRNPIGRVLNRFTKDMGTIDDLLPTTALDVTGIFLTALGVLVVVAVTNQYIIIPTVVLVFFFYKLRQFYLLTARDVKRLEGIARSPVFSHISTSLYGLTTIRAFGAQNMFEDHFYHHQDHHTRAWFTAICASRWFGIVLDWMCVIYVVIVTVFLLFIPTGTDESGGNVGLGISSALLLCGSFQWGVRQSAEMESQMTSVERVLEYTKLESEAELEAPKDRRPPDDWPQKGEITFQNMSLSYSPSEPPVLKGLCCHIRKQEKVGIVGRTGAGKSSMIGALFRMTEPDGVIVIDSIITKDIGLHDLRRKISIIPQDPVLFTGTVRQNIDPFGKDNDSQLWAVLAEVQLKDVVETLPGGLETYLTEGGSNFSVGQRQLICMARAILRNNRILVLDEATANVDTRTDALIQKTIREKFQNCTVLTIAHRLNTIMDCDRVMVLDAGCIQEFDEPHLLLQNDLGVFTEMVKNTGLAMADQLKVIALEAYQAKHGGKLKSRPPSIRSLTHPTPMMKAIPESQTNNVIPETTLIPNGVVSEVDKNELDAVTENDTNEECDQRL